MADTASIGRCNTGSRSPRKISSLANPNCSSQLLAVLAVTIAINHGVAARLTSRAGETLGIAEVGVGDADISSSKFQIG